MDQLRKIFVDVFIAAAVALETQAGDEAEKDK